MVFVGQMVRLMTFNGTAAPTSPQVKPTDDYWRLIGTSGRVVNCSPPKGIAADRVLVAFSASLDELGLANDNEIANALWVKVSDLSAASSADQSLA
jgi:hypothetical protein